LGISGGFFIGGGLMNYQAFTNDSLTMMYEGDGCDLRRLTGRATSPSFAGHQ
jgi:hypothetical protein